MSFQLLGGYGFTPCFTNRVTQLIVTIYQRLAKVKPHFEGRYVFPKTLGLPDLNTRPSADVVKLAATFESENGIMDEAVLKTPTSTSRT